jgi:hypothetical protein
MRLRQDTGLYAHDHCVQKSQDGQPIDQPDLFGEDKVRTVDIPVTDDVEELIGQDRINKAVEDAFEVLDEYHARVCVGQNNGRCKCP